MFVKSLDHVEIENVDLEAQCGVGIDAWPVLVHAYARIRAYLPVNVASARPRYGYKARKSKDDIRSQPQPGFPLGKYPRNL